MTPEYASPEQIRGEPVTTASDVYALGVLLYELLAHAGRPRSEGGFAVDAGRAETERRSRAFGGGRWPAISTRSCSRRCARSRSAYTRSPSSQLTCALPGRTAGARRADTFGYRAGKVRSPPPVAVAAVAIATGRWSRPPLPCCRRAHCPRARQGGGRGDVPARDVRRSGRDRADAVSVRQLLDAQASLLPTAYPDKPEMRAQMTATIAEGYDRLGLFAQAEPLAKDALDQRRAILAATNPDLAVSTSLLGWIKYERGQAKEGEELLRQAVELWHNVDPENPRGTSRTLNDLGVAVEAAGKYAEADTLQRGLTPRRAAYFRLRSSVQGDDSS